MSKKIKWYHLLVGIGILLGILVWFQDYPEYKLSFANRFYTSSPFASLGIKIKGQVFSDPVDQMMTQAYRFLLSGEPFSTWNSYNSFGYPITCWDILLSPFNWFYLLGLERGQLLKYIVKYALAFSGMTVFLKHKRLHLVASVAGGFAFCFSSAIVVWGGWPHSDVIAIAPWAYWCADQIIECYADKKRKINCYGWLLCFCLLVYLMLVAGMPTYAAYFIYVGVVYVIFQSRTYEFKLRDALICLVMFSLAIILAGMMSFVYTGTLLFTTTQYSEERLDSGLAFWHLGWEYLRTMFFPFLRDGLNGHMNETTLFSGYLALLIVPVWQKVKKKSEECVFWAFLTGIIILLIFVGRSGLVYQYLPMINSSSKIRVIAVLNFSWSILGAFAFDHIITGQFTKKEKISISILYVILLVVLLLILLDNITIEEIIQNYQLYAYVICFMLVIAGGILCVSSWRKLGMGCVLLSSVFIGALFTRDYMPLIERNADVLPAKTASLQFLSDNVGEAERITGLDWAFPPNLNQYYGMKDIRVHGFIATDEEIKAYCKKIDNDIYATNTYLLLADDMENINLNLLKYASVKYVMRQQEGILGGLLDSVGAVKGAEGITEPSQIISQEMISDADKLSGFDILLSTYAKELDSDTYLIMKLIDSETLQIITEETISLGEVEDNRFVAFEFSPIEDSKDKKYQLEMSLSKTTDKPLAIWVSNKSYREGELEIAGERKDGDLCFIDIYGDSIKFEDNVQLQLLENYCPRAYFVDDILVRSDLDTILEEMSLQVEREKAFAVDGEFSEESLTQLRSNTNNLDSEITWIRDDGDEIQIETYSNKDTVMVLTDLYDKEWHAYVDGEETDIHKVNYLFRGIELPSGKHTVEFHYVPRRLYACFTVTVIGYLVFAGCVIVWIRKRRKERRLFEKETD